MSEAALWCYVALLAAIVVGLTVWLRKTESADERRDRIIRQINEQQARHEASYTHTRKR